MSTISTTTSERPAVHTAHRSRARNNGVRTLVYHTLVAGFGLVMIYPILWLFASSFKSRAEIWTNVSSLIPQRCVDRSQTILPAVTAP